MMPAIILALHFESELGSYFEETYAWHNRNGPFNTSNGFRMLNVFDLYFGFQLPWWNGAVDQPAKYLPETMQYLEDNFNGDEYVLRKEQIMKGLNAGRDELIKITKR